MTEHLCWSKPDEAVCAVCGAEEPPPWPRVTLAQCHHCGHIGDPAEDHTCPCPFSDAECQAHVKETR